MRFPSALKKVFWIVVVLVGAVGIELVGQSVSLAESTALAPLQPSKSPLEHRILATSWPRIFLAVRGIAFVFNFSETFFSWSGRTIFQGSVDAWKHPAPRCK
jgi:hypothetical protein